MELCRVRRWLTYWWLELEAFFIFPYLEATVFKNSGKGLTITSQRSCSIRKETGNGQAVWTLKVTQITLIKGIRHLSYGMALFMKNKIK